MTHKEFVIGRDVGLIKLHLAAAVLITKAYYLFSQQRYQDAIDGEWMVEQKKRTFYILNLI